jgi:hypothetical protein
VSKGDIHQKLDRASEITLNVKGRKSGKDIPRPVWFAYEGNTLYLLPVQGSDTNWYKNMLAGSILNISVNSVKVLAATGKPITDINGVNEVMNKFKSKYGEGDVKKYYTKFNAAVEVPI